MERPDQGIDRVGARPRLAPGARRPRASRPRRSRRPPFRRRGTRTRARLVVRGVMTNGGFETMRSKRSPARVEEAAEPDLDPVDPVQLAFSAARSRARREMSVATTRSRLPRRGSAWMPHPVPRSSPVSRGRGSTGRTGSSTLRPRRARARSAGVAERRPRRGRSRSTTPPPRASTNAYGRRSSTARTCRSGRALASAPPTSPSSIAPYTPSVGSAAPHPRPAPGSPSTNSRASVARSADAPCAERLASSTRRARHAFAAMQRGLFIRAPQRLECRDREVGRGEVVAEAGQPVARARAVLHGVDAHRTIQPHGPPADPTGRPARTARPGIAAGQRPLS